MSDLQWALAAMAGLALLLYLTTRIEPHWASRDGRRMIATCQFLDTRGVPRGRPFDARVVVTPDDLVLVRRRGILGRRESVWRVAGRSPDPPRRRQIFVLRPAADDPEAMLTLRLPARSRAVPVLAGLTPTSVDRPGTWRSDPPAGRG